MSRQSAMIECPACQSLVPEFLINSHLDSNCAAKPTSAEQKPTLSKPKAVNNFFKRKTPDDAPTPEAGPSRPPNSSTSRPISIVPQGSSTPDFNGRPSKRPKTTTATGNSAVEAAKPLAERVRPNTLDDVIGQEHLLGPNGILRSLIENDRVGSMVLWGPPGTGKTTLARLIAGKTEARFKELSATEAGTKDVREVFTEAANVLKLTGKRTFLFVDEIQRFNKGQQDLFLPYVESGTIIVILATTENPSFRINSALLSRCRVFVLEKLSVEDCFRIMKRALLLHTGRPESQPPLQPPPYSTIANDPGPSTSSIQEATTSSSTPPNTDVQASISSERLIDDDLLKFLAAAADGDARVALSTLEMALTVTDKDRSMTREALRTNLRKAHLQYDRSGDHHYDTISALHKSIRGGDSDAALYWLARMLGGGDDPLYVARRMIRMASEDIGLADPQALTMAVSAYQAGKSRHAKQRTWLLMTSTLAQLIGMPECDVILAQVAVYLSEARKSIRVYKAYGKAKQLVESEPAYPVPFHIRNAPTRLMKDLGYGKDYRYEPGFAHPIHQTFRPPELEGRKFLNDEDSLEGKKIDMEELSEWERKVNHGEPWEGRQALLRKLDGGHEGPS